MATIGLKAIPNDPHLLLEQATLQMRTLPAGAKPTAEQQQAIRADAEAAKKNAATAPEAHFLLGQLEERTGAGRRLPAISAPHGVIFATAAVHCWRGRRRASGRRHGGTPLGEVPSPAASAPRR